MELVIKKWGRSLGAVIPKEKAKQLELKENDVVHADLFKEKTDLSKLFGALKMKRSIDKILEEADKEW